MKPCQKPTTSIDRTEIIPFPLTTTTPEIKQIREETAADYLWLIKLADMGQNRDAIKSIYAEVMYQRKKSMGAQPEDYIVPLMRVLREEHPFFYQNTKRFIERKYDECFPGQEPVVSAEVMERLKDLAEGGAK
jgi:hypothetical protein